MANVNAVFSSGVQRSETIWTGPSFGGVMLGVFQGEVTFEDGQRGACAGVETIDLNNNDAFRGNLIITLPDGSVSRQVFEGQTVTRESDGKLQGTGVWSHVQGNGRFEGLTGGGTFRWHLDGSSYEAEFSD